VTAERSSRTRTFVAEVAFPPADEVLEQGAPALRDGHACQVRQLQVDVRGGAEHPVFAAEVPHDHRRETTAPSEGAAAPHREQQGGGAVM